MTTKTATILVRTEPEIKENADRILSEIGLTTSGATNIFLHQVVQEGGLPFRPRLARPNIPDMDGLTEDELGRLMNQGIEEVENGKTRPFEEVVTELEKKYAVQL